MQHSDVLALKEIERLIGKVASLLKLWPSNKKVLCTKDIDSISGILKMRSITKRNTIFAILKKYGIPVPYLSARTYKWQELTTKMTENEVIKFINAIKMDEYCEIFYFGGSTRFGYQILQNRLLHMYSYPYNIPDAIDARIAHLIRLCNIEKSNK